MLHEQHQAYLDSLGPMVYMPSQHGAQMHSLHSLPQHLSHSHVGHPQSHLHMPLHAPILDHPGTSTMPSPTMLLGGADYDPDYLRNRFMYSNDLQQMMSMASMVHQPQQQQHLHHLQQQHQQQQQQHVDPSLRRVVEQEQHVTEAASPGIPGSSVNAHLNHVRGHSSPKESVPDSPARRTRKRRAPAASSSKREPARGHTNGDTSDGSASSGEDNDYAPVGKEKEVSKVKKRRVRKTWTERFEQLKEFRNRFGHCKVPKGWSEDPKLARWVCNMRQSKRMGKMKPERVRKLEDLGFLWRCEQSGKLIWEEMLSKLQTFQGRYGHANVPKRWPEDEQLSAWIVYIRQRRMVGTLSPEKVRELERLGFVWEEEDDGEDYADDSPRVIGQQV